MSRYAWLACPNRRLMIWLGKIVTSGSGDIHHFKIGNVSSPPNSRNEQLNRVVWKFLAETAGEELCVITDMHAEYEHLEEYREIGGDGASDIPIDSYLTDWRDERAEESGD